MACLLITQALLIAIPAHAGQQVRSATLSSNAVQPAGESAKAAHPSKDDLQAAKDAYRRGLAAEQKQDWESAYQSYADAATWAPDNLEYLRRRESAKGRLIDQDVDAAELDAVLGKLSDAREKLLAAHDLAPGDDAIQERLAQLQEDEPVRPRPLRQAGKLASAVRLSYSPARRNVAYRGDTEGAWREVARQFGVSVSFEPNLRSVPVRFELNGLDFPAAARILGDMTHTFWSPLGARLFAVAEDNPANRREYEQVSQQTILLPSSMAQDQMTEVFRLAREITGILQGQLDIRSHTITLRASPAALAIATDLISNLEQPGGEVVLDFEVLEMGRNAALQMGILPPQTSKMIALSPQQIQKAQQSTQGLIDVISQVFGLPSSLSGLSPAQIASQIASGELNPSSLIPGLVAFGGGDTFFLATLPGASANVGELLSTVKSGRRILLRSRDGQPATLFVGERVPISLEQFSSSLAGTSGSNPAGGTSNFPVTNFAAGSGPDFVISPILRPAAATKVSDLVVANFNDNTLSVLLGNGDGTFQAQTTIPTGAGPAWIAAGSFRAAAPTALDLAVANENSNSISIFTENADASGNPNGAFTAGQVLTTGVKPVSVVAANFRDISAKGVLDLAVANQPDDTIAFFQNNGTGTFTAAPSLTLALPAGFSPAAIAVGDFNSDGHQDMAIADQGANRVSIFLGNGDGTFRTRVDYAVGNRPAWVSVADFNLDGIPDLAVANSGTPVTEPNGSLVSGNSVAVLLGAGDGTFQSAVDYPAGQQPMSIAVADFNRDGLPDLAVADETDNAVSVLLGVGAGQFSANFELGVGASPVSITSADFNGDSRPDVAVANNGSANVSVILNESSSSNNGVNNGAFPGGIPFNGAQYFDVGVKIKATPRMHPDGQVTLQLDMDLSSLTGQSLNGIPFVSHQQITQTVRVKEGQATALASLLAPQVTATLNGAPGLADIPGIGYAGKDQNNTNQDTEVIIVVTPHVVRYALRQDHVIFAGHGILGAPGAGILPGPPGLLSRPFPGGYPPRPPQSYPNGTPPAGAPYPGAQPGTVTYPGGSYPPGGIGPGQQTQLGGMAPGGGQPQSPQEQ